MLHIPLLRNGVPYVSLDVARPAHHQTGRPYVEVSQANVGLIRRDLLDQHTAWRALQADGPARTAKDPEKRSIPGLVRMSTTARVYT